MMMQDKKVFVMGCSFSHHDGPIAFENPNRFFDYDACWPAMMAKEYNPKLLVNGSIPGSGNDTYYQRGQLMLKEYGTPDLVIIQLTFPHRFLWSTVPYKNVISINHPQKIKNYGHRGTFSQIKT